MPGDSHPYSKAYPAGEFFASLQALTEEGTIRTINIVLIVAVALQTVGCSTWQPLVRANEVSEHNRNSPVRDQVLGKLTEGMRVRIGIREGAAAPIKGNILECIVEEIGQTSMTLIPITDHIRDTVKREFRLHFADILHIEKREFNRGLTTFEIGLAVGTAICLYLIIHAWSRVQLD